MKKNRIVAGVLVVGLALGLAGCASQSSLPKASGFLPDYSLLKPVPSPAGIQIYTYQNPAVKRSDYNAVLIAPVVLYQTATANGVTQAQIDAARDNIQNGLRKIVNQSIAVTSNRGPGVAQLNVAITGAALEGDGFHARNLIPISAAIKLASTATDLDKKTPVLVVELKFVDSMTGKLLRETVTTVHGDQFRNRVNTAGEFALLAQQWVQQALQYSSGHNSLQ